MALVEVFNKEQQKQISEILASVAHTLTMIKVTLGKANTALDNINEITNKVKGTLR